jgi:hypothetical protein
MDDVQHLVATAKEESYLFVADSRTRDTAVFPSPSEYELAFAAPFRNVFGLDIIDASIARTEYIVDAATNTLEFVMNQPVALIGTDDATAWNQGRWVTAATDGAGMRTPKRSVTLDPGDYNLPQFIEHLNAKLTDVARLNGEPAIKCAAVTNPSEISNRIVFTCLRSFTFLMGSSTLRHTLGFGEPVQSLTSDDYRAVPGWTVNITGGASDAFLSVPGSVLPDIDPQAATTGPIPSGRLVDYDPVYGTAVLRQYFDALTTGPITQVLAYVHATAGAPSLAVRVVRVSDNVVIATGTLVATPDDPNDVYEPVAVTMAPVAGLVATQGQTHYVEFTAVGAAGSSAHFVGVYYSQDNLPVRPSRYITLNGEAVHPGQNLSVDVIASSWGHALRCPGIVDLTGPRFVNIRCPDIESHMFRDRVNETCHAGMGMVKLAGYGFREQRFDFVSFPPRRFHPIGKLTKLRVRLERPDGSLYASHGIDHTLLMVLRFYSLPARPETPAGGPGGGPAGPASSLNPHYTPDLRRYMIDQRWTHEARATDRTAKRY